MCTCSFPDNIIVCPSCKRDDEGYKLGMSESPFKDVGNGQLMCICGQFITLKERMLTNDY